MFTKAAFVLVMITACCSVQAQVKHKIKKSRRNKAESRFTLAKNDLQVEWETGYEKLNSSLSTFTYPNATIHYGITSRFEVNTEMSVLSAYDRSVSPQANSTGIEPISAGFNYLLSKESYNGPAVIAAVQLAIPFLATKNFAASHLAPLIELDIQQPFSKKLTAGISPGVFWDGFSTTANFIYNAHIAYAATKKWQFTSECFGFINGEPAQHNFDTQVDYTLNKHWQVGCTGGFGLSKSAHKSYVALNGVWGINTRGKKKKH